MVMLRADSWSSGHIQVNYPVLSSCRSYHKARCTDMANVRLIPSVDVMTNKIDMQLEKGREIQALPKKT